jgi:hypothetical protein
MATLLSRARRRAALDAPRMHLVVTPLGAHGVRIRYLFVASKLLADPGCCFIELRRESMAAWEQYCALPPGTHAKGVASVTTVLGSSGSSPRHFSWRLRHSAGGHSPTIKLQPTAWRKACQALGASVLGRGRSKIADAAPEVGATAEAAAADMKSVLAHPRADDSAEHSRPAEHAHSDCVTSFVAPPASPDASDARAGGCTVGQPTDNDARTAHQLVDRCNGRTLNASCLHLPELRVESLQWAQTPVLLDVPRQPADQQAAPQPHQRAASDVLIMQVAPFDHSESRPWTAPLVIEPLSANETACAEAYEVCDYDEAVAVQHGVGSAAGDMLKRDDELVADLERSLMEVEMLLRTDLHGGSAAIVAARAAVADGLALYEQVSEVARTCSVRKGKLLEALDASLAAAQLHAEHGDAGAGGVCAGHAVLGVLTAGAAMPQSPAYTPTHAPSAEPAGDGVRAAAFGRTPVEWAALARRYGALRGLVRIKLADENDLATARAGLQLCDDFFHALVQLAKLRRASLAHTLANLGV